MDADERGCAPIDLITEKVIGAAYKVANVLGCGFLEKVYENALAYELRKQGLHVEQQKTIDVYYDGVHVGYYVSDLFVEHQLPVELKVAKALDEAHFAQALNFLKSSGFKVGLLLNFGTSKIGIKRVVNNY
jgi:GxxExxY protein